MLGDILVDHLLQDRERDGAATKDNVVKLPKVKALS